MRDIWLTRDGVRFAYRRLGRPIEEFNPTLFVSGAFQTMDSWARFAQAFSQKTTVLLVDPPGMGSSEVLPVEFGADFLASCVLDVLDSCDAEQVNIVAASYGTPAAHRLAQLCPGRIGKIVLIGTAKAIPVRLHDDLHETIDRALQGDREGLAGMIVDGLLCNDERRHVQRRALARRVLSREVVRMSDVALRQYAANTARLLRHEPLDLGVIVDGLEALVLTGEHDCFTAPAACFEIARSFRNAWFTLVEEADHLIHLERFDVLIDLLMRFMEDRLGEGVPGCTPLVRVGDDLRLDDVVAT